MHHHAGPILLVLCLACVVVLHIKTYPYYSVMKYNNSYPPIDLVYLWVNGSDPRWQHDFYTYIRLDNPDRTFSTGKERFIEHDELRYALRSAYQYVPWIHTIYIVTNGQVPHWLDINHPQIRIISHKQIMPETALPTFNSYALETRIHLIPNLTNLFLFSNDDFYFLQRVGPSFFFTSNWFPIVRSSDMKFTRKAAESSQYCRNIIYSVNLFSGRFGPSKLFEPVHTISSYRKDDFLECANLFPNDFNRTTYSRFRSERSVHRSIVSYYSIKAHSAVYIPYSKSKYDALYMTISSKKHMKESLIKHRPKMICVNDTPLVLEKDRIGLREFLSELFPVPGPWELSSDDTIP